MWPELESVCTHKALLCSAVEDTVMCSKEREEGGARGGEASILLRWESE